jgi:chromate transporter
MAARVGSRGCCAWAGLMDSLELKKPQAGCAREVFLAFLRLGVTSFGGPVAHLGYFRSEFVLRRQWLSERAYADLVALCQFLPGPASTQVGFSIGLGRAGYAGALAAWAGFTLPSAALLTGLAYAAGALSGRAGGGLLHGLKLVAVAIVAQAVLGMARTLCPDLARAFIAIVALTLALLVRSAAAQILVIVAGALLGLALCRGVPAPVGEGALDCPVSRRAGLGALTLFLLLLVGLPLMQRLVPAQGVALFAAFYRCGALVFGGGHVVLPLLRAAFVPPGWVSDGEFLAGYGAAQAVPGPLFSFAAYLGAIARSSPHALAGAVLGLIGLFLPGLLILVAALPFWATLRRRTEARAAILGVNAAVVGLLAAALYDPVWSTAVRSPADIALALGGFALLTLGRVAPWVVVLLTALGGVALGTL